MKLIIKLWILLLSIILSNEAFSSNYLDKFKEVYNTLKLASNRIDGLKSEVKELKSQLQKALIDQNIEIGVQKELRKDREDLLKQTKWLIEEHRLLKKKRRLDNLGLWIKTDFNHVHAGISSEISYRFTNWIKIYSNIDFKHEFVSKFLLINYALGLQFDVF